MQLHDTVCRQTGFSWCGWTLRARGWAFLFGGGLALIIAGCPESDPQPTPQTAPQIVAQLVQEGYLKASNTRANDQFGFSVALAGDTLAVGAPYESSAATGINGDQADGNAPQSGAVYVFTRDPVTRVWRQQAYVKASNTEALDRFGWSVALAGDTLAVGAWGEASTATGINGDQADNNAPQSGAVYVFTRDPVTGVWNQQAYVKASNTGRVDAFGASVALAGDTLAVGAWCEASAAIGINGNQADNSASCSGAAYVFTRDPMTGIWSQQAYVKASNTRGGNAFGWRVTLADDTLAVGAHYRASARGAVYMFTRNPGTSVWSQQAYVQASNAEVDDQFGWSVALAGDALAVGAPYESSAATGINGNQADNSAFGSGAVYVFQPQRE